MSPIAHFLGSWLVAAVAADNPRDRRLITLAGVLPDLDGAGILADFARHWRTGAELDFTYYQQFHHLWLHGWPGVIFIAGVLAVFAREHWRVALWGVVVMHLHLLCDLLGSRGPSVADLWPICYSEPIFRHPIWFWRCQWRLDGWQNAVIALGMFGGALVVSLRRGFSFAEVFGSRADRAFTKTLRAWAGKIHGARQGIR